MSNEPAGKSPVDQTVEPCAWRVRRRDAPEYWIVFLHAPVDAMVDPAREVQPLVTLAQAGAMVAAERERGAQICEQWNATHPSRLAELHAKYGQPAA